MPDITDTNSRDVFLCRQPILDRQRQLFAYALPFRGAGFTDGGVETVAVVTETFSEPSLAEALGPYQGFIKVGQDLLFSDRIHTLPPQTVVLEILDSVIQTPEMIDRCEQLRHAGYALATHARAESSNIDEYPLLRLVEFIKVDTRGVEPKCLERLVQALKPLRRSLLAEGVDSDEQRHRCHEFGFDLFQGYHFARPAAAQGQRLQSSEAALLRLLGLISQDADTAEIEVAFKQEPALTINLLRLTNSAGSGLTIRITSLRHAITLLGRRQLLRWLQLLLYSGASSSSTVANPLLQLAATRGRLMELLIDHMPEARQYGRNLIDQAFMVGILSLMPILLGAGFGEALARLPLAAPVLDALGERRGVLGELLALVEALEEETPERATLILLQDLPGLDAARINACLAWALVWANNLAR
ncbi:MAG: EAL domain-containing protein [Candidatus Accumulibacter sp.]|jgi:EAL and modified HD-GYP domain-containing signal transduction protein|nr:EAL domain-containing protein [Accumulibacter sp.]